MTVRKHEGCQGHKEEEEKKYTEYSRKPVSYLLDPGVRSLWRRFLNQFETCVRVRPVFLASCLFSSGVGYLDSTKSASPLKHDFFFPWLSTVPSKRGLLNKWIKGPSQDRCWLGWPVVLVHVLEGVPWLLLEAVDRLFAVPDGPWEGELPPQPVFVHSTCNMVSQSTIALAFIVNNDNILIYLF